MCEMRVECEQKTSALAGCVETTTYFRWQKGQRLSLVQEVAQLGMSVELARSVYIS